MQKEIGSIFPAAQYDIATDVNSFCGNSSGIRLFSLCREALFCVAEHLKTNRKVIMIPAYTCHTVIEPFLQANWNVYFFPVDERLCIKKEEFLSLLASASPDVILFHPYYGKKLMEYEKDLLRQAKKRNILIIQDLTQSLFSPLHPDYVDITVGSIRKWFGVPDGAFLSIADSVPFAVTENEQYNTEFTDSQWDAMYLRGEYFRTGNLNFKKISIRLNKYAESLACKTKITPHKISDYSLSIIRSTDFNTISSKRIENFKTLLSTVEKNNTCIPIITSPDMLENAPLYFPLYVRDRGRVQKFLAANSIYAPILWGVEDDAVLEDGTVRDIYEHLLAIPIDQRYDRDDMLYIANGINEISNHR